MRLYAKKYNNKKSRFARASARFSALALNGNALNCNEKLNVSVDSCSTLASLVPLLAWARENVLYFYFILTNSCVYDKINSTREKIYGKAKI